MHKPGILFALPWKLSTVSEVNRVVIDLARVTRDAGQLQPMILCNDPEREDWQIGDYDGIPLVSHHLHAPADAGSARNLAGFALTLRKDTRQWRRFFDEHAIRVVNAHHYCPGYTLFSLLHARRRIKFRLVYSLHGGETAGLASTGPASRTAGRWVLRQADRLVCCSESLAGSVRKELKFDPLRVHAVPGGIDPDVLDEAAGLDYRPSTGGFDRYLVSVGSFNPHKGHDVLIRAYLQLVREGLKSALVLVGRRTPHLAKLLSIVRANGLHEHVFFFADLDYRRTLAAIRHAQLLVQPSLEEAFGLPLIEAAYLQTPVVATATGGIPEALGNYYPYLASPGDVESLARTIDEALFNPTETRRQVHLLHRRVVSRFTCQRAYEEYLPIWAGSAQ